MARFCGEKLTEPKLNAALIWKDKCLLGGQSAFGSENIWTSANVDQLNEYFVNNLDEGEGDFFEKLEAQIEPTSNQVKQLAAEMLWVMLLCPSNIKPATKRASIERIWQWSDEPFDPPAELWSDEVLGGIGSSGTSFNTNRWRELVYFIKLTQAALKMPESEKRNMLEKPWEFAHWLEGIPENDSRQLRHMILFLLFPDTFERIFGGTDRKSIVSAFTGEKIRQVSKLSAIDIDRQLDQIRKEQEQQFETDQLDFYVPPLREQWKDVASKQWLLTWNPRDFQWDDIADAILRTQSGESYIQRWPCSNFSLATGDKAWVLRQRENPTGIFAVGNVVSEVYEDQHWDSKKAQSNTKANYVDIELTLVLDVFKDTFITHADLENIKIDNQNWQPDAVTSEIKKRSAGLLERLWNQIVPKQEALQSDARRTQKDPVNMIYYGPPGTGKTYELNTLIHKYVAPASSVSYEQWLAQELQPQRWFDVIFMALHDLGGSAKVSQIEAHQFVQQKAKSIGRTKHIRAQIWATLQTHTVESSNTVNYSKRQTPFVFDKDENSVWSLSGAWRDPCEEQVQLYEAISSGPQDRKAQKRYEFVTFHQAFSYEEFVEGLRPEVDEDSGEVAYKVVPGVFRRLCQLAQNDPNNRYAIFIDEINRGNIAKIFGELITLIEIDKRGEFVNEEGVSRMIAGMSLTLPYSGESFSVPKNIDIYGTMNTADRSIALLDTALRRRFIFKELMPNSSIISGAGGDGYIPDGEGGVINLRALLDAMNKRIQFFLGRDVTLGHAYLSKVKDFDSLRSVLLNQFIPLLQEHFYDDWERIQMILGDVGPGGRPLEPQIISHRTLSASDVFGFEPDGFESIKDYQISSQKEITPDAIRKIYESVTIGE